MQKVFKFQSFEMLIRRASREDVCLCALSQLVSSTHTSSRTPRASLEEDLFYELMQNGLGDSGNEREELDGYWQDTSVPLGWGLGSTGWFAEL